MDILTRIDNSKTIKNRIVDKYIVYFKKTLDHDGYDRHGPQSNLYDIHIIIKEHDDYIYYWFHKEKWFRKNDDKDYYLYLKVKLSEATSKNIHNFPSSDLDPELKLEYDKKKSLINIKKELNKELNKKNIL